MEWSGKGQHIELGDRIKEEGQWLLPRYMRHHENKSKILGHKEKFHSKGIENLKKIIAETSQTHGDSCPDRESIENTNSQDQKRTAQCHILFKIRIHRTKYVEKNTNSH